MSTLNILSNLLNVHKMKDKEKLLIKLAIHGLHNRTESGQLIKSNKILIERTHLRLCCMNFLKKSLESYEQICIIFGSKHLEINSQKLLLL